MNTNLGLIKNIGSVEFILRETLTDKYVKRQIGKYTAKWVIMRIFNYELAGIYCTRRECIGR